MTELLVINRRTLLQATTLGLTVAGMPRLTTLAQDEAILDEITIDLSTEPASLAPALIYEPNGWSIAHAIFDAPLEFDSRGNQLMIAAESMRWVDELTLEIRVQGGKTFHNGRPLTAESLVASHRILVDPATASSIAGNFATITSVEAVDDITARITVNAPSPWLPAQIAAWMLCLPPDSESATSISDGPIGTGPYKFVEWVRGDHITLEINPDYNSPLKGKPIAKKVNFRFVADSATRVADLQSGLAQIIRSVPVDSVDAVTDSGGTVKSSSISGVAFVRIATDTPPFDDVRVRQAINLAVDVDAIRFALLAGSGERLPNIFVPSGMGYDDSLAPFAYDPEAAKALLTEAGVTGLKTTLAVTNSERKDIAEAIASYLTEVGIETTVEVQEIATFNGQWTDPAAAPLRFASWRPMFDPFNLLNLVFNDNGFLSRHKNANTQTLIDQAAVENDPATRESLYKQLGQILFAEPAALYLWDLTAVYGTSADLKWSPRPDDAIVPTFFNR